MKRFFVFLLASVMLVSVALAEEYDIRELKWGMSFEKVQQVEGLDANFYKSEDLLGIKVEVLFGCDNKGLYSVTYSTRDKLFAKEAQKVMVSKYGEPKTDLDYAYLLQIKEMLKKYPDGVTLALEKEDYSGLTDAKSRQSLTSEKSIIKSALSKRNMWEFGDTVALLLDSYEVGALAYWSKSYYEESKKKFIVLAADLKKNIKKEEKKKTEEGEKF